MGDGQRGYYEARDRNEHDFPDPVESTPEPLSDERLDMLEDDFRAGRGCFSGWGLALVAEVRGLRKALLKRGDHTYMCMAKFNDGPCSCGWEAERTALAGEPHEQREGP